MHYNRIKGRREDLIFLFSFWLIPLLTILKLKTFVMRIDIFSIPASDAKALMQMQVKLNQWLTNNTLKKYEIHTAGEFIIFNVCRNKGE